MLVAGHLLLVLALACLVAAAGRVAGLLTPSPLERVVAGAVLAATAAVAQALVLGVVDLGGSRVALAACCLLLWLGARWRLPAPERSVGRALADWLSGAPLSARVAAGAIVGIGAAWIVWQLRHPALGMDMLVYHLPEAVAWVQNGTPGSIEPILPGLPVGNYPLTDEVLLSFFLALPRSLVAVTLWPWALLAVTAAAGWLGLRELRVPRLPGALAVATLCTFPQVLAWQSNGAATDPASLAWLVCCGALAACSARRPVLLAPALLAGALAAGTKTTVLPLVLAILAIAILRSRFELRALRWPLAAALAGAMLVGGVWYLRNLVTHGSPLWPFKAAPWGDPEPSSLAPARTFLERPGHTLDTFGRLWVHRFGGGLVLLAAAMAAPLVARSRRQLALSVATVVSLLLWTSAPLTGVADVPRLDLGTASTIRYLLPATACAALAVALAARGSGALWRVASAILGACVLLNLVQTFRLGYPAAPSLLPPLLGALAGGAAGLALSWPPLTEPRRRLVFVAGAVAALGASAALALAAQGFVARNGRTGGFGSALVAWFASQPGFGSRSGGIAVRPAFVGTLAGDELRHRLRQLPAADPCASRPARTASWLVVGKGDPSAARSLRPCLPARPGHEDADFRSYRLRP
jgi:hypothetical protein